MKIAVLRERRDDERRVAATPDSVKKLAGLGAQVHVETRAGAQSGISDDAFAAAGAQIAPDTRAALEGASLLLCVQPADDADLEALPEGAMIAGMLDPHGQSARFDTYNRRRLSTFSLELLPRISRAQAMDVLSSQSNLAGYRAVIEAVAASSKVVPMMMTAAGTVAPAKALILGAGVAGLQAIATARRLGAVVSAFDVRAAAREQVQSLGAKFIEVPTEEKGETAGGYAREMSEDYRRRQSELLHETLKKQDLVITTALIPGKPAPTLVTEEMVKDMKPGSVIVDLAAGMGGNCPLTVAGEKVERHGVTLIGYTDLASRARADSSQLYARNLYHFVSTLLLPETRWDDELVTGTLLTRDGATVHKGFA